jgi:peptide/nickel transport system permease protein
VFGYVVRRLLQGVFVLWAAYTLSFFILYLLPGNAAAIAAAGSGDPGSVDPALVAKLRHEYGLDRPLAVQYVAALGNALRLNFGNSVQNGAPATQLVAQALPQTVTLALSALPLALVFGVGIAVLSNLARWRWLRQALSALPLFGASVPGFWIGLLLLEAFSFNLHWFPSLGVNTPIGLVLPAITLAIPTGAYVAQLLSRSLRLTLAKPFIEQVRAKGASEKRVHLGHALRNALIPSLTLAGVLAGQLLAGTVVTETVFSRVGVGRLAVTAVGARDIPVVQVIVVFAALVFVLVSIIVDLLYPLIDRRIVVGRSALAIA